MLLDGALVGTPGKLKLTANASIDDFRRYDVLGGGTLHLVAHCGAEYSSLQKMLSNVDCNSRRRRWFVGVERAARPARRFLSTTSR